MLQRPMIMRAVLSACALMLTIVMGSVMNESVYSQVALYCGVLREVATFASSILYGILCIVVMYRPRWLDWRMCVITVAGSALAGIVVLMLAIPLAHVMATALGLIFLKIATVSANVSVIFALFMLDDARLSSIAVCVGTVLGESFQLLNLHLSADLGVIFIGGGALFVVAILAPSIKHVLGCISQNDAPAGLSLVNPESFLKPFHGLYIGAFCFSMATGFGLAFNEVNHAPLSTGMVALLIVASIIAIFSFSSERREDRLFSFSALAVIAGFLAAPFTVQVFLSANELMRIGAICYTVLLWLVVLAIGRQNMLALIPTFTLICCMRSIGTNIGAIAGHTANDVAPAGGMEALAIIQLVLFAFIVFLWIGFRSFSFTEVISGVYDATLRANAAQKDKGNMEGLLHVSETPSERQDTTFRMLSHESEETHALPTIEEVCERLGKSYGLTERETEIFAMLARGRNGQFVMDTFVISRNTVKTHVKHIYTKLGVHSQQELIDLIESHMAQG